MRNMEEKKQQRKAYPKGDAFRTGSTQKMISFKLDKNLLAWLNSKRNKGRYINELIKRDMHNAWIDDEHTQALEGQYDYEEL